MNAINKVIFNALATRQGVGLPEVGTLKIVRKAAYQPNKKQLKVAVNRVDFSTKQNTAVTSILAFISTEADIDAQQAQDLYAKWLDGARQNNIITIEGAGQIKNNHFTPTQELNALLNPFVDQTIVLKPRRNNVWLIAAIVAPLLIIAGVLLWIFPFQCSNEEPSVTTTQIAVAPQPTTTATDSSKTVVNDTVTKAAIVVPAQTIKPTTTSEQQKTTQSTSSTATYHVIVGVFSTVENADNCIKQVKSKDSSLPVMKLPFKNGKIMVSIYSSQNESIANQYKTKLTNISPDLWLYNQPSR